MQREHDAPREDEISQITLEFESLDSMLNTINSDHQQEKETEERMYPELLPVRDGITDAFHGLRKATEKDSRGKMRHIVQEYAGREDMPGWQFGHHLRVLEAHGLAKQDGKRWRVASPED